MFRRLLVGDDLSLDEIIVEELGTLENPEDLDVFIREFEEKISPEGRERLANEMRQYLRDAGLKAPDDEFETLEEMDQWRQRLWRLGWNSRERLTVAWLSNYEWANRYEADLSKGNYSPRIMAHFRYRERELGRLEERLEWRTKAAPATEAPTPGGARKGNPLQGKSPAQLAKDRLDQIRALRERNEGRAEENRLSSIDAETWRAEAQVLADQYWREDDTLLKNEVAARIRRIFERDWPKEEQQARAAGEEPRKRRIPSANLISRAIQKIS